MYIKILGVILLGLAFLNCGYAAVPASLDISDSETKTLLKNLLPAAETEAKYAALAQIRKADDKRFIAPLVDIFRFQNSRDELIEVSKTLRTLTGVTAELTDDLWETMTEWIGVNTSLKPPTGYTAWKGELHAQLIDPRFKEFLYDGAAVAEGTRVAEVVWGGVKVDGIPALVNPKMLVAGEADYMTDDEPVFGVSINGDNRAYPLRILDWHEMANDVVGGKPVALAYCTLCGAGVLFETTVGKRTFEFGSSGFLMRSNKLMYDRETKTLWNQLTGKPVIGKLVGENLELKVLPVVVTSWGRWKADHADTKVLSLETGYKRPYQIGATYGRYFASPRTMFPVWKQSRVLPKKARIYAIQHDGLAKAYPLDELNRAGGVANDKIGAKNLVVVYRDAVGRVPLPAKLQSELKAVDKSFNFEFANDLTLDALRKLLDKQPQIIDDLTVEIMLAVPTEARLTLLNESTSDERTGTKAGKGKFTPNFRNDVAQRGLAGETRAFERGSHIFKPTAKKAELLDEKNKTWRITEDALIAPDGEKLPRLGGHLAFWFGWFSYFSQTEVYKADLSPK
ncbi:MAG: DUF3179 domain-containing protein [Pyrinomonadaceae bacterium]